MASEPAAASNEDVTVVVTYYDQPAFLAEAVASALAQEGGAPAVVVVDDGSPAPGTEAMLAGLPAAVTVHRQPNAGPSAARNAGMRLALTPLLLNLDGDDRLRPDALRRMKDGLRAHPQAGFSYGQMRYFGAWEGEIALPPYDPFKLLYRHMIGVTALLRRELLDDVGGFDESFRGYEDWELWVHALACGWRGVRVDAVTLDYRRHAATTVNRAARRRYRTTYARLRDKHAGLYARAGELAREGDVGLAQRLAYRWFWGPRPIPAAVETALHGLLWRPGRRRRAR